MTQNIQTYTGFIVCIVLFSERLLILIAHLNKRILMMIKCILSCMEMISSYKIAVSLLQSGKRSFNLYDHSISLGNCFRQSKMYHFKNHYFIICFNCNLKIKRFALGSQGIDCLDLLHLQWVFYL